MPQARDDNFQAIGMTIGHALRIKNAARLMTNLLRRFLAATPTFASSEKASNLADGAVRSSENAVQCEFDRLVIRSD